MCAISAKKWKTADDDRPWKLIIGPIISDSFYFVTRHPLPILGRINPFGSLDIKIWFNYSCLFIVLVLASVGTHVMMSNAVVIKEIISSIISPWASYWANMFIFAIFLKLITIFTFWTFNILFGVDLWSALVG